MIYERFKIICNECGGEDCYISAEELFSDCGDEVVMSIICPDCKERETRRMDIMERELD
ncbi:hypothetical protein [Clostridium massiliamazoniense]|uniref:hypothetical protein n=1 Tax=Clostridium massiliamazoniense TaxID=1347366 RepID=UPI000A6504EA|nr:hypothetical protein [Clostridium massiliamazoniense]